MQDYRADLIQRYWCYVHRCQFDADGYLDTRYPDGGRPVFKPSEAWRNVIVQPGATDADVAELLQVIPARQRHKWFRSMNSSQALALSVLGNLRGRGLLGELADVVDDDGTPAFGGAALTREQFTMESEVTYLGERRRTSLDGFLDGPYRVTIECKFTEADVGTCSRPRLKQDQEEYCSGAYQHQGLRTERCALAEIGVAYWNYVPRLFTWPKGEDHNPCPLAKNYQLVRNVLAIGVTPDGAVSLSGGHALLIYDGRNPAFQTGGKAFSAFELTQAALRNPAMLRKCSWQRILAYMRAKRLLPWLTEELDLKYGL